MQWAEVGPTSERMSGRTRVWAQAKDDGAQRHQSAIMSADEADGRRHAFHSRKGKLSEPENTIIRWSPTGRRATKPCARAAEAHDKAHYTQSFIEKKPLNARPGVHSIHLQVEQRANQPRPTKHQSILLSIIPIRISYFNPLFYPLTCV